MIADATAVGTIRYDTYVSNTVPVAGANLTIGSDEITLILDATNQTSGHEYDVFAYSASGTLTLCAGPAWTNDTTRSQAIVLSGGVWTNSGSMTHCFNNSVDAGPIASHAGTYLGTFRTTANAQTGMQFRPTAASGGTNSVLYLYNAYNRVLVASTNIDSKATWTDGAATWQPADPAGANTNNRISFVDGLGQSFVNAQWQAAIANTAGSPTAVTGLDEDSTTATPISHGLAGATSNYTMNIDDDFSPALGLHFIQAMEFSSGATITFTASSVDEFLKIRLMM